MVSDRVRPCAGAGHQRGSGPQKGFPTVGRLQEPHSSGICDSLAPVLGLQLAEDVLDVGLYRVLREHEAVRDLGVGEALSDELEDLLLTKGQVALSAPWTFWRPPPRAIGLRLRELLQKSGCHGGRHHHPPMVDLAQGVDDLLGARGLENVAEGAHR